LQEQRTQAFHELDQHHKIFLCHAPKYEDGFEEFKKGVSGVTERFQKISLEIIEIKKLLEEQDPPQTQSASMIARVQELEEKKLSTVVDLQLARQQVVEAVSFFELKSIQPASDNFCVCSTVCYSFRHWTILAMSSVRRMQTLSEQV